MPWKPKQFGKRQERREDRKSASQRGYNARWQKARLWWLRQHPLCAECAREGVVRAADVVDHVVPHRGDEVLFWDVDNWMSLCKRCHDRKTGAGK
jgi:5-methylcytosine-specific restriction protein A